MNAIALWRIGPLLAGLVCLSLRVANAQVNALQPVTLTVGGHLIQAEVAKNDADRARGLMFRPTLKPNEGMLFVFNQTDKHCFWMRNTKIPLSIAFIDAAGIIINIEDMYPETLDLHCPIQPVRYALEMNLGWYTSKDIKLGMKVGRLPKS